ncbi:MAG: hypothetical protein LC650_04770 [Actinobacteria bacterium]|nr:hypothetical protein [Actinomycetota bacterium]
MTSWTHLEVITELLVEGFFGTELVFSIVLMSAFLLLFTAQLDMRYGFAYTLPLVGAFAAGGLLGAELWVLNLFLMILGTVYAFVILRLTGNITTG